MKRRSAWLLAFAMALHAQVGKTHHATGPFDVDTKPITDASVAFNRLSLTKHYHGGLEAASTGEMLAGGGPKSGTGGYVAIETVTGALDGKSGTFQLMHWGTMEGGKYDLRISVIPGSGTGALQGITGNLNIEVAPDGKHYYVFDYALPEKE
jgi:expansin (peptidoglycan-binding protein)